MTHANHWVWVVVRKKSSRHLVIQLCTNKESYMSHLVVTIAPLTWMFLYSRPIKFQLLGINSVVLGCKLLACPQARVAAQLIKSHSIAS